jgi:hypothetical protein
MQMNPNFLVRLSAQRETILPGSIHRRRLPRRRWTGKWNLISDEGRFTGGDYEKLYWSPARTVSSEKNEQTKKSGSNIKNF